MSQENEVITLDIRGEDGSPMVRLFPDGRLEFGQHYDPRDAALIFWRSLSDMRDIILPKPKNRCTEGAPRPSQPCQPIPYGLVSLWDLMQPILLRPLIEAMNAISSFGQFLQERQHFGIPKCDHEMLFANVRCIADQSEILDFAAAVSAAEDVIVALNNNSESPTGVVFDAPQSSMLHSAIVGLVNAFRHSAKGRFVLSLPSSKVALYDQKQPLFGDDVDLKFRSASEDVSEAGKCLALGRSTACVFHLMRTLEHAVAVLGDKLGATIVDEHGRTLSWGVIASNIKPKIDKMQKGSDEQLNWYRVHAYLESVGRAWRNPTNHPKQTYTQDEAEDVMNATKAFMKELTKIV